MTQGEWRGLPLRANGSESEDNKSTIPPGTPNATALLLHETIIRALQMVLNVWKRYVEEQKKLRG